VNSFTRSGVLRTSVDAFDAEGIARVVDARARCEVEGYAISESLSQMDCLSLLDRECVGRLGVSIEALPAVLPINYLRIGEAVYLRASSRSELYRACVGSVVAFEVDGYDQTTDSGWSVLVRGIVYELLSCKELEVARSLWQAAWPLSEDADRFLVLPVAVISGWRFVKQESRRVS
jgi:uncharacterized protein